MPERFYLNIWAVMAHDWSGVLIAWDNGEENFFNNMAEVELAKGNLL